MPPETSDLEIFADASRKKRQGKKGKGVKIEKKRRKIAKREGGKWKIENEVGKVIKRGEDFFFFFFFFFFFSLLKTTEICFGSTKMGIFTGKKHFTRKKKSGKMTLPPLKNKPVTPLSGRVHFWYYFS